MVGVGNQNSNKHINLASVVSMSEVVRSICNWQWIQICTCFISPISCQFPGRTLIIWQTLNCLVTNKPWGKLHSTTYLMYATATTHLTIEWCEFNLANILPFTRSTKLKSASKCPIIYGIHLCCTCTKWSQKYLTNDIAPMQPLHGWLPLIWLTSRLGFWNTLNTNCWWKVLPFLVNIFIWGFVPYLSLYDSIYTCNNNSPVRFIRAWSHA